MCVPPKTVRIRGEKRHPVSSPPKKPGKVQGGICGAARPWEKVPHKKDYMVLIHQLTRLGHPATQTPKRSSISP